MKKVNCFGELSVGSSVWSRVMDVEGNGNVEEVVEELKVEKVNEFKQDNSFVHLELNNGAMVLAPKELGLIVGKKEISKESYYFSVRKLN